MDFIEKIFAGAGCMIIGLWLTEIILGIALVLSLIRYLNQ